MYNDRKKDDLAVLRELADEQKNSKLREPKGSDILNPNVVYLTSGTYDFTLPAGAMNTRYFTFKADHQVAPDGYLHVQAWKNGTSVPVTDTEYSAMIVTQPDYFSANDGRYVWWYFAQNFTSSPIYLKFQALMTDTGNLTVGFDPPS